MLAGGNVHITDMADIEGFLGRGLNGVAHHQRYLVVEAGALPN
jgi:hypothetical protein